MPVSYRPNSPDQLCYLTPAPFVAIDKNFDKAGNGEILGVRYTITLTGTMVADRGSPSTHEDATKGWLITEEDKRVKDHVFAHAYTDIVKKQQLMRNLFSMINEGGRLEIEAPKPGGTYIYCFPRIVSVSFPDHAEGNPFVQPYTIVLEADLLHGAGTTDNDDLMANGVGIEGQYITDANESWDIEESDERYVTRDKTTKEFKDTYRTYRITHQIGATGKRRFDVDTDKADGIDKGAADTSEGAEEGDTLPRLDRGSNFWSKVDNTGEASPKGEAWYQAREFVRKQLKHGFHFQTGRDSTKSTDDDKDKYGINLPKKIKAGRYGEDADLYYVAFNYVKTESLDELGGSFAVTETWLLAPDKSAVTETMDISIVEEQNGDINLTLSGNIQGLGINIPTSKNEIKPASNDLGSSGATDTYQEDYNTKFTNASNHFNLIEGNLYKTARGFLDASSKENKTLQPVPNSRTIGKNPTAGIVTYNFTFRAGDTPCIPNALSENISVNDTYPGHKFVAQAVIGRKRGPVLQDIGTQTVWKRTLQVGCKVDTITPEFCKNASGQRTIHRTEDLCKADNAANQDPVSTDTSNDHYWVTNLNATDNCVTNFNSAKPSMVHTKTRPDTKSQRKAIRELIDAFKPNGTAVYIDPSPAESWNPKTGDWSYTISWTYEIEKSYICDEDVDDIDKDTPAASGKDLNGSDETKYGDKNYPGTPR